MELEVTMEGVQAFVKECFVRGLPESDTTILLDRYLAAGREVARDEE